MNKFLSPLLLALAAGTAYAQTAPATPRVDARQERQDRRIDQGQASGQLTAREVRRLDRQQAGIARAEDHAKSDGSVSPHERKRLQHLQNHSSGDIRHQKHDRQRGLPASGANSSAGG